MLDTHVSFRFKYNSHTWYILKLNMAPIMHYLTIHMVCQHKAQSALQMCIWSKIVKHYSDVIMSAMASQITSLTIVYPTVYSSEDQRKHQSCAPLALVRGIQRRPVNSPHRGPVTRKMFPFDMSSSRPKSYPSPFCRYNCFVQYGVTKDSVLTRPHSGMNAADPDPRGCTAKMDYSHIR